MNAYELNPDEKYQVSFSGGRTSGYLLYHLLRENQWMRNSDNVRVVFSNTGREAPETYKFIEECQREWNVNVVWVELDLDVDIDSLDNFRILPPKSGLEWKWKRTDYVNYSRRGEPYLKLVAKKRLLPNAGARFCTEYLKVWPANQYLKSLGWKQWTVLIGYRADEAGRLTKTSKQQRQRYRAIKAPLIDAGARREDVDLFWMTNPFDLDMEMNAKGYAPLNNCTGCFLKSESLKAQLYAEHPQEFEWWNNFEKRFSEEYGKPCTFRRDYSLQSVKDFVDQNPKSVEKLDDRSLFCQKDGGSCEGF